MDSSFVTELMAVVVNTVTTLVAGLGSGVKSLFDLLFVNSVTVGEVTTTSPSTFAYIVFISLGIGLSTFLVKYVVGIIRNRG